MSQELRYHGGINEFRRLFDELMGGLAGRPTPYAHYLHGIKLRVGMVALACVQEAFVVKADGGTGEDGVTWPPLKRETIAQRPISLSGPNNDLALLRSHGVKPHGKHERGLLTPEQNKRWRFLFATRKAWLRAKHGMGDGEASARAAQIAWATLKAEGAKTKLEVLGGRHVQIGRNTGRLFASLSPGTEQPESHPLLEPAPEAPIPEDRILRIEDAAVIIGSNLIYAGKFHALRHLWPVGDLPAPWAERIVEAARSGVVEAVTSILKSRAA